MIQHIRAIYENGVLRPPTPLNLPDDTQVDLAIESSRERVALSDAEVKKLLDEFAVDVPKTESTFSREDIYFDHD
jgi:predicted DNA-binding antitoxin AbrB/MazE fold protein